MFGEFTVVDFNFGLVVDVVNEFLWFADGVVINPQGFEVKVFQLLDNLIDFILP